jgi:hypothetical protein
MQFRYFQSLFISLALSDKKPKPGTRRDSEYEKLSARAAQHAKEMLNSARKILSSQSSH